jgi:hypothetical protein
LKYQDTRWNICDQINKEFDPSTMSLTENMRNFQTFVLKHHRFNANYGREEVLDQLKNNITNVIPNMDYHFDRISQRFDPWVTEIQYLVCKAPKNFSKRNMTRPGMKQDRIFPTHLNAVSTNESPHLHQVTSLEELKDLVNKTYHVFRKDKFTPESHEHPQFQAYRAVYAVFKNDPTRLNLSVPALLRMKLDDNIQKQITVR